MEFFTPLVASIPPVLELDGSSFVLQVVRLVGFLGILSVGAFIFTRVYKGKKILSAQSNPKGIQISDSHSLGNRQFLIVAEYAKQKHLLGVSPGSIQHLTAIREDSDHSDSTDC